jgi:hypothetical protein
MKTSLWIVVVLVAGIVGFLLGYSTSSSTGARAAASIHGPGSAAAAPAVPAAQHAEPAPPQAPAARPAEKKPAAAGY